MAVLELSKTTVKHWGRSEDLVYCYRYGKAYARQYVEQHHEPTAEQLACRNRLRDARAAWRGLPEKQKASWRFRAAELGLIERTRGPYTTLRKTSGYLLFVSAYMKAHKRDEQPR